MTEPDPLIGSTIAGIRLDEKLGAGGMGSVYRGFQTGMARVVAVKILSEHLSSNAEYISRFRREAVTAGKLEHANIVTIYDIGHEGGRYFIVMQFIEGRSLQRILDVVGPLPPKEAAGLMVGVLRGLQNAHAAGVVHRDIKPGNIIVTKENEPKILDFGLAVGLDPRDRVTGTGSVLGTPLYISPEQARGKAAEPRSDLYSTGVMFYALLTGRVPFSGQDPLAVLNMHIQENPVSPINLNPRIPQALNDIVLKMLAKHPEERHASAEAVIRDIQAYLEGKLLALPPRPAPRLVRRQAAPVGIIVGAVLGVILVVGLAKLSKSPSGDPLPPPRVQNPPPGPDPELAEVREKAEAILALAAKDGPRDYAVYPHSFGELNRLAARYANRKDSTAVLDAAKKTLTDAAERFARTHEAEIRPRIAMARADGDFYLLRELLREFPRPFLDFTETGKAIAAEIKETEGFVGKKIASDLESIPRLLEADEFDGARARLKKLGDVVPPELRSRVAELLAQADAAEAERRLQLIPKLLGQIADHEKLLASLLDRRQSDEAWNLVLGFVESHPPTKLAAALVRMTAVPVATLRRIVPSTETEEVIDSLLLRFEAEDPAKDEDSPANRLRNLCEDILRWEWIRRRADRGIQRLAGTEVALHSFGGIKGKIVGGPSPTIDTGSGTPQPILLNQLEARDLVFFAAAAAVGAENAIETVFKSPDQRRLALSIAAAYRYSPTPDRNSAAFKWAEQARLHGMRVPAQRLASLEEAARQERDQLSREMLGKALDHAAAGRFEKAHEELDKAAKEHQEKAYYGTLEGVIRDLHARFLLAEAEEEAKGSRWSRALAAVRQLRTNFAAYEPEKAAAVFHKVLLQSGQWSAWPMIAPTATSKTWNWDGKATGTRPPGRAEGGQILLTDVGGFRPLFLERAKTLGATGLRGRIRWNQLQQTFEAGFLFDARETGGDHRRFLIRSTGRGEVATRREGRFAVDDVAELKPKIAAKEWFEVAIVSDGTETVFYFGPLGAPAAVLTLTGLIDAKGGFGLWANADTTFSDLYVRDAKP